MGHPRDLTVELLAHRDGRLEEGRGEGDIVDCEKALANLGDAARSLYASCSMKLHFPRKPIGEQAPADEISPPHLRGRKLPQPWSLR